eukprot:6192216-Pleurochrysis_carterae.AAC.1
MPEDWDGGPFYKCWEVIGPFGLNDASVSVTPAKPNKRTATGEGDGRNAQRKKDKEESVAKVQKPVEERLQLGSLAAQSLAHTQRQQALTASYNAACRARDRAVCALPSARHMPA